MIHQETAVYNVNTTHTIRCVNFQTSGVFKPGYFKDSFAETVAGNRDYGKLMSSTIDISANNL